MAEFENGYCTGCGYHKSKGHRPYCWRHINSLSEANLSIRQIRRCLIEMAKHHRIKSLFLARDQHIYFTVKSIDAGIATEAYYKGLRGFYRCDSCGYSEIQENEVHCWECSQGEMVFIETRHPEPLGAA